MMQVHHFLNLVTLGFPCADLAYFNFFVLHAEEFFISLVQWFLLSCVSFLAMFLNMVPIYFIIEHS
jgi:hypothetical protein